MSYGNAVLLGAGMLAMGYMTAAAFFLKFWRQTKDRLFLIFAVAFVLLALNQGLPPLFDVPREEASHFYLLRLGAFLLIIVGIVGKNLRPQR